MKFHLPPQPAVRLKQGKAGWVVKGQHKVKAEGDGEGDGEGNA